MLVNIICQDSGVNLYTIELDFPRPDEQMSVTQMAMKALKLSGLKTQGYMWCGEVQQQKTENADFLDIDDCDDPVEYGAIYRVLVMQKKQRPENSNATDFEVVEMDVSGKSNEVSDHELVEQQQSQSISPFLQPNVGQTSMEMDQPEMDVSGKSNEGSDLKLVVQHQSQHTSPFLESNVGKQASTDQPIEQQFVDQCALQQFDPRINCCLGKRVVVTSGGTHPQKQALLPSGANLQPINVPSHQQLLGNDELERLVPFEAACPLAAQFGGKCPNNERFWACESCMKVLRCAEPEGEGETAAIKKLWCGCGKFDADIYRFRCCQPTEHSAGHVDWDGFAAYNAENLKHILKLHMPYMQKTVLVIGSTGHGKSTMLNSLVNYLHFKSFEEAVQDGPLCVIPSKVGIGKNMKLFERTDCKDTSKTTEDLNAKASESQTLQPVSHVVTYKGGRVRFVDTPGMNHSAKLRSGPSSSEQDRLNLDAIIDYAKRANILDIHGVLFVQKSSETRNKEFKGAMEPLLRMFTKEYEDKIHFVYSWSDNMREVKGQDVVQDYLEEYQDQFQLKQDDNHNYYLENKPFEELAKMRLNLKTHDVNGQKKYWDCSQAEAHRLLNHLIQMEPTPFEGPLTQHKAKKVVDGFLGLHLKLEDLIKKLTREIECHKEQINALKNQLPFLESQFWEKEVKTKALDWPNTCCSKCKVTIEDSETHKICHEACQLPYTGERTDNPDLKGCWMVFHDDAERAQRIDNGESLDCLTCGCHNKEHFHSMSMTVVEKHENHSARTKHAEKEREIAECRTLIEQKSNEISTMKSELSSLYEYAARIVASLNNQLGSAPHPHDAMEEKLQSDIEKFQNSGDLEKAQKHEKDLAEYRKLINIYTHTKQNETTELSISNIPAEIYKKFMTCGPELRKIIDTNLNSTTTRLYEEITRNDSCTERPQKLHATWNGLPAEFEHHQQKQAQEQPEDHRPLALASTMTGPAGTSASEMSGRFAAVRLQQFGENEHVQQQQQQQQRHHQQTDKKQGWKIEF